MQYQELLVLLPSHSLEDFPTQHEGDDAQSLLASWSALWHPAFIASAGVAPSWRRVDDPPQELAGRLITVPTVAASRLPTGYAQRVKESGGLLIRKTTDRREIVQQGLAALDTPPTIAEELVADFLALGYAFLVVQLLTRQTRYTTNLDEPFFFGQVVAAAQALAAGDEATGREKLSVAFNLLAEEREHFFPVEAYLVDLTLVAATTLGKSLQSELGRDTPLNLLLPADVLDDLATKEPTTLAALKASLAAGKVGLIGGGLERRWPLVGPESVRDDLRAGLARFQSVLGTRPKIFGRTRFGLTPHLPSLLAQWGFTGALHINFEDGGVPDGNQSRVRWESLDDRAISAIARPPLDAAAPQTFLQLSSKLGEAFDSEQSATLSLAHWPGQGCDWLDDLRRTARYCRALGMFITLDEYFATTGEPGQLERFHVDRYKSPYLKQAIIRKQEDPLTTSVRYWNRATTLTAAQTCDTLAALISGKSSLGAALPDAVHEETTTEISAQESAERLATALTGKPPVSADRADGFLVLNPLPYVRRIGAEIPGLAQTSTIAKPLYAAGEAAGRQHVVVDVPPLGFVYLPQPKSSAKSKDRLLVEDNVLRNEYFEAVINPITGALSAVREYNSRGNRLSQQLALRTPGPRGKPGDVYRDPDETAVYSVPAADKVTTTIATAALGEVVVQGRLMDLSGRKLAGYQQTFRIWRGVRVLEIEIELDPLDEPKADPWNSYYCCRWAWADPSAELFRTVNLTRQSCGIKRFEAPNYVELLDGKHSTTILTGGLPFHRRHEDRMFDTLLLTRGERGRKFRVGIGIDLTHPLQAATAFQTPTLVVPTACPPASGTFGWLLQAETKNIAATHWSAVTEGSTVKGFRVRLLETEGRGANFKLSAFRQIRAARRIGPDGAVQGDLPIEGGAVRISLAGHEWVEVEAIW